MRDTAWLVFFTPYSKPAQVLGCFSSMERAIEERDFWKREGEGSDYRWYHSVDNPPLNLRTLQGDMLTIKPIVVDLPISSWQFHQKAS